MLLSDENIGPSNLRQVLSVHYHRVQININIFNCKKKKKKKIKATHQDFIFHDAIFVYYYLSRNPKFATETVN